ncbi:HsdM family class I SAM-dependent methyltransferase [Lacinutrix chionoecetis]
MSNIHIFNFLKSYSSIPFEIDRLIVSSFLRINEIHIENNLLLKKYNIENDDLDFKRLNAFINLIKKEKKTVSFEDLILLFEFVVSPADKEVNGAVYTPKNIREFIINDSTKNNNLDNTVCDVACGCGGFLYEYAIYLNKKGKKIKDIIEQNLFGIDIADYSIERTKLLLSLLAITNNEDEIEFKFNLFLGNSLDFDWFDKSSIIKNNGGFDYIYSNPPYVGSTNLDLETKELIKNWYVSSSGKLDLYIPFFEIGLKWLKTGGVLGYITVNNFYRSLNGRALRRYFSKNKFKFKFIDFGGEQIFKGRNTYTCICEITKESGNIHYTNSTSKNLNNIVESDFVNIDYSSLDDFNGWQLDDVSSQLNILRLENSGSKLIDLFEIRNGFATLRNKIYLFNPTDEDDEFYYFISNSKTIQIERDICRDAIKPNIIKIESDVIDFNEKLIFPYKVINENQDDLFQNNHRRLVRLIPEKEFRANYPFAYSYLESQKTELSKRDKGNRTYEKWYAFGRSQALSIRGKKLLFPYISNNPYFVYTSNEDLLFYNGYALVSDSEDDLKFIQKILKTDVFWYYIKHTSKPYSGNYFALAKNYVKNFSIPPFSNSERRSFMNLKRKSSINKMLLNKYNITDIELND